MARTQSVTAKKNIVKAQKAWKGMTGRQRALAQPQGRKRAKSGSTGKGNFYRINVRPKGDFLSFRVQDVGEKGGLERIAGRRSSGSWDTVSWLISKDDARIDSRGRLEITDAKARSVMRSLSGRIVHVKGDIFQAHPRTNVAESAKPTSAMRRAQKTNISKAQRSLSRRRLTGSRASRG